MFSTRSFRLFLLTLLAVLNGLPSYAQPVISASRVWYNQHLFNNNFSEYRRNTIDFTAANNLGGNRVAIWPHQLQAEPGGAVLHEQLTNELEKQIDHIRSAGQEVYIIVMPFYPKHWTGFPRNGQYCHYGVCTSADVTWHCLPNNGTPHQSWKDPDCARGGQDFPPDLGKFAEFIGTFIERFKYKIQYIGFANEPFYSDPNGTRTFFQSTPDTLINILRIGFDITKSINPGIRTVCPDEDDPDSLKLLFQKGMSHYCDVIGVHAYPWPKLEAFRLLLREYEPIMQQFAPDKELWLTELGDYDNPIVAHVWSEMLAEVRKYPRITKIFPITVVDEPTASGANASGLVRNDRTPKEAWYHLKAFADSYPLPLRVPIDDSLPTWAFPDLSGKDGNNDYVLIQCMSASPCPVLVTVTYNDGSGASEVVDVLQRLTIGVHAHPLTAGREVSMAVQALNRADANLVYAEHSRYWGPRWRAGTNTGNAQLLGSQQFAEGVVGGGFNQWLTVYNTNPEAAYVDFKFVDQNGNAHYRSSLVPGPGRLKFRVNDALPGFVGTFSTEIKGRFQNGTPAPLAAEREVTWWDDKREGHAATGQEPATHWWGSEGNKGSFATYVLIANLTQVVAQVRVRYLMDNGQNYVVDVAIPANTRYTQTEPADMPNGSYGFEIISANNVPVTVERAMYWGNNWEGGHAAPASTRLSKEWSFAEGTTGGSFQTFLLLANPTSNPSAVTLTFRMDDGSIVTHESVVPANGRLTVPVDGLYGMENRTFSTHISSSQEIVAERAMYMGDIADGFWMAGHASLGQAK